jgi:hypothetical protein
MPDYSFSKDPITDQKLSLAECRRLVSDKTITDQELLEIRDLLYAFCNSVFDELAIFPPEEQTEDSPLL